MNKREKTLALIVGSLLPILLAFWVIATFSDTYFSRLQKLRSLQSQVTEEEDRVFAAEMAQKRRKYYAATSVPQNVNQAVIDYENWFNNIAENVAGLKITSSKVESSGESIRYRGKSGPMATVAEQFKFTVRATGTLDQITTMLERFYSLELMHRIYSMSITKVRSDSPNSMADEALKLEMEIQFLKMQDAPENRDFVADSNLLPINEQEVINSILARNFFGPANNSPVIATSSEKFFDDQEIEFLIRADDADRNDNLTLELVSSSIPDAKLEQKAGDRRATFQAPKMAIGTYEAVVRVKDSGLPNKMAEKKISIAVNERPVEKVEIKKDPPPFQHAQGAYITGFRGDRLRIDVKTKPEQLDIAVGESFKLDGKTWTVESIESWRSIVIRCEDQLLTFRVGDTLDAPREKKSSVEITSPTSNDVSVDGR